jgi:ectoine hydroxylase-related dioxygenase (phytanoyl-CoA dioxygenase family)
MLTQAQIDSFHRDGYLVMPGLVRGPELKALQDASAKVVEEGIARRGEEHRYPRLEDGRTVYARSEKLWSRNPTFRAVTVNPELLENIGQCIGHSFFPWNDSLVVKIPHDGAAIAWHQDPPYGKYDSTYVIPNFTTDIYLDDSDEDNGCVWAIPGHHLVGHVRTEDFTPDELFARANPVRMKAGDVLFHALSTPHGSRANRAPRLRRTFYVHYLSQETHDQSGYRSLLGKPWWGEGKREQIAAMAADRAALGWSPAFGPNIVEREDGLEFTGAVRTPRRHWGDLSAQIPTDRRDGLKTLREQRIASVALMQGCP